MLIIASAETQEEKEVVFETELPDDTQWLFHSQLQKKAVKASGGCFAWLDRQCVLTPKCLMLTKPGTTSILDWISLTEITGIEEVKGVPNRRGSLLLRPAPSISNMDRPEPSRSFDPQDEDSLAFVVHTSEEGSQAGQLFCLKAESTELRDKWVLQLRAEWQKALAAVQLQAPAIQRLRRSARWVFNSRPCSILRFLVIMSSFAVSIISDEYKTEDKERAKLIQDLQLSFTVVFTFELAVNAFAHWREEFVEDKWNWFDTIIVILSIMAEGVGDGHVVQVVRLLRSLRVIRLFRLFRSLNNITTALAASLWPVLNTFVVLFLVSCIYAVIATELYSEKSEEFFGSFSKSLFSMFQVSTGDSWASGIGRTLRREDGELDAGAMMFLVSNVLVVGLVLINVVVAVLLDTFLTTVAAEKEHEMEEKAKKIRLKMGIVRSPLHPLLESLQGFYTNGDLSARIQDLFKVLDSDESNSLSFRELRVGLRKLPLQDPIIITPDDFEVMTEGYSLCNADKELDSLAFERVMRHQLRQHVQMQAQSAAGSAQPSDRSLLFLLKQIMIATEGRDHVGDEQRGYGIAQPKKLVRSSTLDKKQSGIQGFFRTVSAPSVASLLSPVRRPRPPQQPPPRLGSSSSVAPPNAAMSLQAHLRTPSLQSKTSAEQRPSLLRPSSSSTASPPHDSPRTLNVKRRESEGSSASKDELMSFRPGPSTWWKGAAPPHSQHDHDGARHDAEHEAENLGSLSVHTKLSAAGLAGAEWEALRKDMADLSENVSRQQLLFCRSTLAIQCPGLTEVSAAARIANKVVDMGRLEEKLDRLLRVCGSGTGGAGSVDAQVNIETCPRKKNAGTGIDRQECEEWASDDSAEGKQDRPAVGASHAGKKRGKERELPRTSAFCDDGDAAPAAHFVASGQAPLIDSSTRSATADRQCERTATQACMRDHSGEVYVQQADDSVYRSNPPTPREDVVMSAMARTWTTEMSDPLQGQDGTDFPSPDQAWPESRISPLVARQRSDNTNPSSADNPSPSTGTATAAADKLADSLLPFSPAAEMRVWTNGQTGALTVLQNGGHALYDLASVDDDEGEVTPSTRQKRALEQARKWLQGMASSCSSPRSPRHQFSTRVNPEESRANGKPR